MCTERPVQLPVDNTQEALGGEMLNLNVERDAWSISCTCGAIRAVLPKSSDSSVSTAVFQADILPVHHNSSELFDKMARHARLCRWRGTNVRTSVIAG